MNLEKLVFAFFIVLTLSVNFGFFIGDYDNPDHHNIYELYAAIIVSMLASVLKFGDRTHMGAVLLATSLVSNMNLILAALVWGVAIHIMEMSFSSTVVSTVVSLSGGALLANIIAVILLVSETVMLRR